MRKASIVLTALLFAAGTAAQQGTASGAGQAGGQSGASQQQGGQSQQSGQAGQSSGAQDQSETGLGTPGTSQSGSQSQAGGQGSQQQSGQGALTTPPQRPGQSGQIPGQGRPGSARQGVATGNQQQVEQLQTALSQLGSGEKGNEALTREITLMVPQARTEQIRQVVNDFSRILSRANAQRELHQQIASTLAAALSRQGQPVDTRMQLTQLQQQLATAGISASDAQTITRNIELLAGQAQRGAGAVGAPGQTQRSTLEGSRSGQSVPSPGQSGTQRPGGNSGTQQQGSQTQTQPPSGVNP